MGNLYPSAQPIIYRLVEFDECDNAVRLLNDAERYWIAEGRARGWPLLNATDGGDGNSGWKVPEEVKAKISKANSGKKRTPEQIERIRQGHLGLLASEETKLKMSKTRKGRKLSEQHKEALKENWYKSHTPETARKISESKIGKPRDKATIDKVSAKLRGRPWSEARRAAQGKKG